MGDSLLDLVSRLVIDNLVLLVVDQILISELLSHLGLVVLENCAVPGSGCLAVAHLDNARGWPGGRRLGRRRCVPVEAAGANTALTSRAQRHARRLAC